MLTKIIKAFFSFSYWSAASVWILLFKYKLKKQHAFSPFVISIGNLSFGGTGKTPMVEYVSSFLSSIKVNHSIVSRGYMRAGKGEILVSDKTAILSSCSESGDEPFLLAHSLPGVPVVVGSKLKTIPYAAHQFASDLVIIDDGFQSLSVVRDLDIVLIDLSLKIKGFQAVKTLSSARYPRTITSLFVDKASLKFAVLAICIRHSSGFLLPNPDSCTFLINT